MVEVVEQFKHDAFSNGIHTNHGTLLLKRRLTCKKLQNAWPSIWSNFLESDEDGDNSGMLCNHILLMGCSCIRIIKLGESPSLQ